MPRWLAALYPRSDHVSALNLQEAADTFVWGYAQAAGFCIVTQDVDFAERSRLYGSPPKVLWLRCGNTTPPEVERVIRQNSGVLEAFANDAATHYLSL